MSLIDILTSNGVILWFEATFDLLLVGLGIDMYLYPITGLNSVVDMCKKNLQP